MHSLYKNLTKTHNIFEDEKYSKYAIFKEQSSIKVLFLAHKNLQSENLSSEFKTDRVDRVYLQIVPN